MLSALLAVESGRDITVEIVLWYLHGTTGGNKASTSPRPAIPRSARQRAQDESFLDTVDSR